MIGESPFLESVSQRSGSGEDVRVKLTAYYNVSGMVNPRRKV